MTAYTAHCTKIPSGYMGQLVEWPEGVNEGVLEDCRTMLQDALHELAYRELAKELPSSADTQTSPDVSPHLYKKGL